MATRVGYSLFFVCFLNFLLGNVSTLSITVHPNYANIDCKQQLNGVNHPDSIGYALDALVNENASPVEIVLKEPGCYLVNTFSLVKNASRVSIIGVHGSNMTVISCVKNVGLAFVNVQDLSIQNVTIRQCGLTGEHVKYTTEAIAATVDLFHRIPREVEYALIIADSENVQLTNLTIAETSGMGLLGINIVGKSVFSGLDIVRNQAKLCYYTNMNQLTYDTTIGGGIYLLYQDYLNKNAREDTEIVITKSNFHNNSYCAVFFVLSLHYEHYMTARELGYTVGSAGGLGLEMAQLSYPVNITVTNSNFTNNTGWNEPGVTVALFQNVQNTHIEFLDCQFIRNGFSDFQNRPLDVVSIASALTYSNNLFFPQDTQNTSCSRNGFNNAPPSVLVKKTTFYNNTAHYCAAVSIRSLKNTMRSGVKSNLIFSEVLFEENHGAIGPVLCSAVTEATPETSNIKITFQNVTVRKNSVDKITAEGIGSLAQSSGQLALQSTELYLLGDNYFLDNDGVAMLTLTSYIHYLGNTTFMNNSGTFGGAMRLLSASYLVVHNNSNTKFINNSARVQGGAIFYSLGENVAFYTPFDCFLYFEYIDILCDYSTCPSLQDLTFHMSFVNNDATAEGGMIYGSTLSTCPWRISLLNYVANDTTAADMTGIDILTMLPAFFTFDPTPNNTGIVSTVPFSVYMESNFTQDNQPLVRSAPGEKVYLDLSAQDGFKRLRSAVVSSTDNSSDITSELGVRNVWFVRPENHTFGAPFTVFGPEGSSASAKIYSTSSFAELSFLISIQPCGFGFTYFNDNKSCGCIPELSELHVECLVQTLELSVPSGLWAGPLFDNKDIPLISNCYYDYCRPGVAKFKADNIDYQCHPGYNRTGLACGSCQPNTSAVLGTSRCLSQCSNLGLLWIPAMLVAGILLVVIISFFGITITEGYINGFIFYCNCLNYFSVYLSTQNYLDVILIPVAFVNLNLGIESCFFNGMSSLVRIVLRLLFPIYLFIIMGVIILLARYFTIFVRLKFSPTQTFATLLLLCYTNITATCIELLAVNVFTSAYGNVTYYGWSLEPAVQYGQGWHGLTVFIAVTLIIVYVLPFPLLLLFPHLLFRIRFVHKFMPLLDALWAPFRPNRRFWLGFRALLRIVPFCLASYVYYPVNMFLLVIFACFVLFAQERLNPFEGLVRNGIDSFFLVSLILLASNNIFFTTFKEYENDERYFPVQYTIITYILLISAYIAFLVASVIQFFRRYPSLKNKVVLFYQKLRASTQLKKNANETEMNTFNKGDSTVFTVAEPELVVSRVTDRSTVNFTELREPLLDD